MFYINLMLALHLLLPSMVEKMIGRETLAVTHTSEVQIVEGSYLILNGKTNVNKFHCSFEGQIYQDTLAVDWEKEGAQVYLEGALLKLTTNQFECGNRLMNEDFQQLLQADAFPAITIEVKSVKLSESAEDLSPLSKKDIYPLYTDLNINVAGMQKKYTIPVTMTKETSYHCYSGNLFIDITDFGLTPPSRLLGLIVVDEKIQIDFYIKTRLIP